MPGREMTPNAVFTNPPRVSIVMPTHNRAVLLAQAVQSVLNQRFDGWELILVDDGSEPPVELRSFPDLGARGKIHHNVRSLGGAASKSLGASVASGDLVTFLDDDDLYDPGYLEHVVHAMDQFPQIDALFVGVEWFGVDAEGPAQGHGASLARVLHMSQPEIVQSHLHVFDEQLFPALLHSVPMAFQRVVIRRESLSKTGLYRSECELWDCEWALRAALTVRCGLLDLPLYRQRADGQGYHSTADRVLLQCRAELQQVRSLYSAPPVELDDRTHKALRKAVSRSAKDLSYMLSQHGLVWEAWSAWALSQRVAPDPSTWKMPVGALWRALKRQL